MRYNIEKSIIEAYRQKRNCSILPKVLYSTNNFLDIDTNKIDGVIGNDGVFYFTDGSIANHEYICFVLKQMDVDLNNAIRICKNDCYESLCSLSSAKFNTKINLNKQQIIAIQKILSNYHNQSWTSAILCKCIFDMGFNDYEDHILGIRNLRKIQEILGDSFDYNSCVSKIMEENTFNKFLR